jgi:uncharacterized OB-fold protein
MSLEWEWKPVSGRGHIYSYEVVHHAIQPGFKEWTPYAVVLVELDEQRGAPTPDEALRVIANLVTPEFRPEPEANVAIGKRVRVAFQDLSADFAASVHADRRAPGPSGGHPGCRASRPSPPGLPPGAATARGTRGRPARPPHRHEAKSAKLHIAAETPAGSPLAGALLGEVNGSRIVVAIGNGVIAPRAAAEPGGRP